MLSESEIQQEKHERLIKAVRGNSLDDVQRSLINNAPVSMGGSSENALVLAAGLGYVGIAECLMPSSKEQDRDLAAEAASTAGYLWLGHAIRSNFNWDKARTDAACRTAKDPFSLPFLQQHASHPDANIPKDRVP